MGLVGLVEDGRPQGATSEPGAPDHEIIYDWLLTKDPPWDKLNSVSHKHIPVGVSEILSECVLLVRA